MLTVSVFGKKIQNSPCTPSKQNSQLIHNITPSKQHIHSYLYTPVTATQVNTPTNSSQHSACTQCPQLVHNIYTPTNPGKI